MVYVTDASRVTDESGKSNVRVISENTCQPAVDKGDNGALVFSSVALCRFTSMTLSYQHEDGFLIDMRTCVEEILLLSKHKFGN